MILINSIAYIVLILSFIFIVTFKNHQVMTYVYAICCCIMTGCLTYSMMKLRTFSQLLAADGIIASKHLLVLHVTCFWVVSILEVATAVVTILFNSNFNNKLISKRSNSLALAQQWLDISALFVFAVLMVTMLTMFVRFGTPLTSAEKSTISMRFLLNFNAEEFGKKRMKETKKKNLDNDCKK